MSSKSKLMYVKIMLNFKQGVYNNNTNILKNDLIALRQLLQLEVNQDNLQMQGLYNVMIKKLQKSA